MARQVFKEDVWIRGPLLLGPRLEKLPVDRVSGQLFLEQAPDSTTEFARFVKPGGGGLKIEQNQQGALLQALTGIAAAPSPTEPPGAGQSGVLALNQEGGDLLLGSASSQVSVPGTLKVTGRNILTELDSKMPSAGGTVTGSLTVTESLTVKGSDILAELDNKLPIRGGTLNGDLAVTGTINGRKVAEDGTKLDNHVAAKNPHGLTAGDLGALPMVGGTLTGALTIDSNLTVTGTVNGRKVAEDGTKLDTHVANTNNPHGTTAEQVEALPIKGGTVNGDLAVNTSLSVSSFVEVGGRSQLFDETGRGVECKLSVREGMMIEDGLIWIFNPPDPFQGPGHTLSQYYQTILRTSTVKNAVIIGLPMAGIGGLPLPAQGSLGFIWKADNRIFAGSIQGREVLAPP